MRKKKNGFLIILLLFIFPVSGYELKAPIDTSVTANPIEVLYWVMPGVTAENEARSLKLIWEGLKAIENIPTSSIRFIAIDTIRTATKPGRKMGQLRITVGNRDSLPSGGASFPEYGYPGEWYGAVADLVFDLRTVAMHEIGHAIGMDHSTISTHFPINQLPVLHWSASSSEYLQDDIAGLSILYPEPTRPLEKETGTVVGRIAAEGAQPFPIPGVNVLAISSNGIPAIGRLSKGGKAAGEFDLRGLLPGTYDIYFKDAQSFHGLFHNDSFNVLSGAQIFNFKEPAPVRITIKANETLRLEDVLVKVENITADSSTDGPLSSTTKFTKIIGNKLPPVKLNTAFEKKIHLRGGVRPLTLASISGLPSGVSGTIGIDTRTTGLMLNGNYFLNLRGTAASAGTYTIKVGLKDLRGILDTVSLSIDFGQATGIRKNRIKTNSLKAKPNSFFDLLGRILLIH